jgi:hypothetical protein
MIANDSNARTMSEKRREQNRIAQRKFRGNSPFHSLSPQTWKLTDSLFFLERHGNRPYEGRLPTPASSSSTAGAEPSIPRAGSISGSFSDSNTPTDITKPIDDMSFSQINDSPSNLMDFGNNDYLSSPELNANPFSLISSMPQDIFQSFGNLPEETPPETESTPIDVFHSPIHMAVRHSSVKIVDLLLKHGVDYNDPDDAGLSPLMHACIRGNIEIVNTLLDAGAAIACSEASQHSPLHWAVLHRREALLKSLLKHCKGKSRVVNAFNSDGQTPLHISIQTGFDMAVEALLLAGADARCPLKRRQS